MKQFLKYLITILFLTFVFCFVLQSMADFGLKKIKNTMIAQWEGILEGTINADMVILGSSRGFVSYDPQLLTSLTGIKTFNLSFNAAAYKVQQIKYDMYCQNNKRPKILIQNIDFAHFNTSSDIPDTYQFLPYLNNEELKLKLTNLDQNFSLICDIPVLKYNNNKAFFWRGLKCFFGINTSKIQNVFDGYSPYEKEYIEDVQNLVRLKEMSKEPNKEKFYKEGLSDLKKFILQNLDNSIKVVLVWAPEYEERYKLEEPLVSPLKKEISDFVAKHEGVYFINMSDDSLFLSTKYFYDSFHLNKEGATLFSNALGIKIKKLKLQN